MEKSKLKRIGECNEYMEYTYQAKNKKDCCEFCGHDRFIGLQDMLNVICLSCHEESTEHPVPEEAE